MPSWQTPMTIPIRTGRRSRGAAAAIMVRPPFWIPDVPTPATARPMMSMVDELATPHSSEPTSKRSRNERNIHLYPSIHHSAAFYYHEPLS